MIPVAINLKNKNILIVGGGKVALQRAKKYISQEANISVVSPHFLDELKSLNIQCIQDSYHEKYLEGIFMVYSATQYKEINHQVMIDCQKRNILCGSATKDEDASFYGMPYRENETGMVAYSSHQKFPYAAPILKQLIAVVDDNKEKLELLARLRPYVLTLPDYHKEMFQVLFDAPVFILYFLIKSLERRYGIIFIYHKNKFDNTYHFHLDSAINLSIEEFKQYQSLFLFDVQYYIVPLVMSEGIIYQQMIQNMPQHFINIGPFIQGKEDICYLNTTLKSNRKQIWILHNRQNDTLKKMFKDYTKDVDIYDFNEEIKLEKGKKYSLMVLLLGHGKHYRDYQQLVQSFQYKGFDIVFDGNLLDHKEMCVYLENKIKNKLNQEI